MKLIELLDKIKKELPLELKITAILSKQDITNEEIDFLNKNLDKIENFELFFQNLIYHKVYPVVYKNIEKYKLQIPVEFKEKLKIEYKSNTLKMMLFLGETSSVLTEFKVQGINAIPLKGVTTSFQMYGDIDFRKSCDIDIIVKEDDFLAAAAVLKKMGYVEITNDNKSAEKEFQNIKNVTHHISYRNFQKKIDIELHWKKVVNLDVKENEGGENFLEKIEIKGREFEILNFEENFVYLASHGAKHCWSILEWLNDLNFGFSRLSKESIIRIAEKAEKTGRRNIVLQMFMLLYIIYDREIPEFLLKYEKEMKKMVPALNYAVGFIALGKNEIKDSFNESQKITLNKIVYFISLADSIKGKSNVFKKIFFNPRAEDIKIVRLYKNFFYLYYLIRPFGYILRKIKIYLK